MKKAGLIRARHTRRVAFSAVLFVTIVSLGSPSLPAQDTRQAETIAPGIEHLRIRRVDPEARSGADRWIIHAVVLDPARVRLALGRAMDEGVGTETTSSIAARRGAVAAVNGGYFRTAGVYRGEPAGILSLSGRVLSEPYRRRPALAVKDDGDWIRVHFSHFDFLADVVVDGKEIRRINGINRPRLDDELILYTPEFHSTTLTNAYGVEAVVSGGLVIATKRGAGSQTIPADGYVLSANGQAEPWAEEFLRPGVRTELRIEMSPRLPLEFDPDFVLGGGPVLLLDGKPAADGDAGIYAEDFSRGRHPRTALGIREDGFLVLVTVDGRQPGSSVGMTIAEITDLMAEFGCLDAINLDGGGSTTMVIRDRIVNSPSDPTGERPVGNALLVFLR